MINLFYYFELGFSVQCTQTDKLLQRMIAKIKGRTAFRAGQREFL
jgi:hypothetical protein